MNDFRSKQSYPLGIRNNNPGNIRPHPDYEWNGSVGENKGFVVFSTIFYGIRALAMDLINKHKRGLKTVQAVINTYAPESENDTEGYIKSVSNKLHVLKSTELVLDNVLLSEFIRAIIEHENGNFIADKVITNEMITTGINMIPDKLKVYLK